MTVDGDMSYTKTYNFELNEVQTQIEKARGTVENLSVAVVINSSIDGIDSYVDSIKSLVAKAIGVKQDYISVELMPFVSGNNSMESAYHETQQTAQVISRNNMIKTIVTVIAVLAFVLILVRFFIRKPERKEEPEELEPAPVGYAVSVPASGPMNNEMMDEDYSMTDLVMKKSSEAEKIEELMDRYPETVAQILRTWLAEDN